MSTKRFCQMNLGRFLFTAVLLALLIYIGCAAAARADTVTDGRVVACIEKIETYGRTLHVTGWAYDRNNPSASLTIDVDSSKWFGADKARSDVNSRYGISGNHGFDFEYTWTTEGNRVMMTVLYDGGGCALYDNIAVFPYLFTLSFNANGGSGAPANEIKHQTIAVKIPSTKPTRPGYTFKGWATSAGGSAAYQPGGSFTSDSNTTLYAVWEINKYTISYNANGGSGAPAAQIKTHGTALKLSGTVPTQPGHTFKGWATSTGGSAAYQPGGTFTSDSNTTLYAVWEINKYTVSYNANGGSGAPAAQIKTYGTALNLSTTVPIWEGHDFLGWATSAEGEAAYQPGGKYTAEANITLYAVWRLKTFSVTYDANGGSGAPEGQVKLYGTDLLLSDTVPMREEYDFLGWSEDAEADTPSLFPGDVYTGNNPLRLYAVWKITVIPGDVNGDGSVDGTDAVRLLRYLADLPEEIVTRNADLNGDGTVNGKDALRLLKQLSGAEL